MRILLTHEQADFDAMGSLLGAFLVDEDAIPVLPNRMNRNVQAFINLYGAELPFVEKRDLPKEPVETVTLVDTQSMISIKGMSQETRVHAIDHHPRRADLPDHWTLNSVEIGATTTLFVETLREENEPLNVIHATLMLMGIYEDTGSLTYARTTGRDLRAAAFLLEGGASLRIAADFLNHPLTQAQQSLYDRLRKGAVNIVVHGHTVVVSCVDAVDMEEEFSTVVHKLRDFLDPDALVVLIASRAGVQLIARSTSDNIDVAAIAAHFGGGGHSRAAAGLIKDTPLGEVCQTLSDILPQYVRPAITVAQIMSRDPQVLLPDTPVTEAARRMQRYGYEGYPVVSAGKVVGLLNRREVDRAVSHNLPYSAANLMNAGEVTVKPDDSIELLQRVMTETGWGQVPVVHPETGQIVGIVTRTDLLKILTPQAKITGRQNLSGRLAAVLPPAWLGLLKAIAESAHEMHTALYIVGGFVRDLLLDRPVSDFDLVVEGDAITLALHLAHEYGGRVTSHARFGTAKWYLPPHSFRVEGGSTPENRQPGQNSLPLFVDFISARTEFYTYPTALPTVERGSIKLDLHRRDFTINTLALRLDGRHYGELHDYWGGLNDLRLGLVRSLHSLSFVDDPTRMLRAVRFEQRFGFTIEERTLQLLHEAIALLDRVSGDRIRHEMDHILDEERTAPMLARLDELGLLDGIYHGFVWDEWLYTRIDALARGEARLEWDIWEKGSREDGNPDVNRSGDASGADLYHGVWNGIPIKRVLAYILLFIRLPAELTEKVLDRLKASKVLAEEILAACTLWADLDSLPGLLPSQVVMRLEEMPPLSLAGVALAASDRPEVEIIQRYATYLRKLGPTITGHDLRRRGIAPGPVYSRILGRLRQAWLDEEIHTRDEENTLLEKLIRES